MEKTIDNVRYFGYGDASSAAHTDVLEMFGLDTEAYDDGKCFLICTSEGDAFKAEEFPGCLFNRKYRGKKFAVWNLKYDEGALLQWLDEEELHELWSTGKTVRAGWKIRSIPSKMLSIRRGTHSITIYDLYQFFSCSLERAGQDYLGEGKLDVETKSFSREYVIAHYEEIKKYCIQDSVLVAKLAALMVKVFLKFKVYPSKLYSTAYVSFQYFKSHTKYPTVKHFWYEHKKLLRFAMESYHGGKFEVTRKGVDHYYEYDIVSAYPAEIANLVDTTFARVVYDNKYRRFAVYGFIRCEVTIPPSYYSPIAVKKGSLCIYPVGRFQATITKAEYEDLIRGGAFVKIIEAVWIHCDNKVYPFKREIERLVCLKQEYKKEETALEYHTVKILLNSLYGKMVQLVRTPDYWKATSCWNPIYASVITANVRIRVSEMQRKYKSVVAVHTDSVISTRPLPMQTGKELGAWAPECSGPGVVLGSGIYQIADKTKFRGFERGISLMELIDTPRKSLPLDTVHAVTWRECAFHKWDTDRINRFERQEKSLRVNFDCKRVWLKDYTRFNEVLKRRVDSLPFDAGLLRYLF